MWDQDWAAGGRAWRLLATTASGNAYMWGRPACASGRAANVAVPFQNPCGGAKVPSVTGTEPVQPLFRSPIDSLVDTPSRTGLDGRCTGWGSRPWRAQARALSNRSDGRP